MKVLALPRDRNPYQERLYGAMRRRGVPVRYLGELTPSRTGNLLLLPVELLVRRLLGWRVVHLHWVWAFALPGARRAPLLRRLARRWFELVLAETRLLGMTLVWTAHNALPHERVFDDDAAARRRLVDAADLVIVHADAAVDELAAIGARPRRVARVAHGPLADPSAAGPAPPPDGGALRLAFVGRIQPYKGVEDLLAALALVPAATPVRLAVVGACPDAALRARIERLAGACPHPVDLTLEHVPDGRLAAAVTGAHAVVLPFRRVTTSGSAILCLDLGRPVVVPEAAVPPGLPDGAVVRYDGTRAGLAEAIGRLAAMPAAGREALRAAAARHAPPSWAAIAADTIDAMAAA